MRNLLFLIIILLSVSCKSTPKAGAYKYMIKYLESDTIAYQYKQ